MTEEMKVQETEQQETEQQETVNQSQLDDVNVLRKGDIVKGKVVKVSDDQAYVDVGYKYDGVIPIRELSAVITENAADAVQVGQEVECKVIVIDDAKESLVLSKKAIDSVKAWDELQAKYEAGDVFEATVADVVKGGLVVDVGVRGFIPASMVERHYVEDFSDYKGRTLRLKVKEIDKEANKVILSQKDVLDAEYELSKKQRLTELKVGQIIEGTVQRITPFGAFVDLGGVDGLVHISELAWQHVAQVTDVVQEGQQVSVKVLKVDPDQDRISLSIKQAEPGPWDKVNQSFNVDDIVSGTVKRIAPFGAFVEIAPGIEGLVHISQIAHRHIATPFEVLKEGQEVKVKILDIIPAEKRVSLSIKETEDAPAPAERSDNRRERSRDAAVDAALQQNESLTITLGERFGDKLGKLK